MGNSIQHQCGNSSVDGMPALFCSLCCLSFLGRYLSLMLLLFLKNLEEKIQRCLELMVGDNRLGKFLFRLSFQVLFLSISLFPFIFFDFQTDCFLFGIKAF